MPSERPVSSAGQLADVFVTRIDFVRNPEFDPERTSALGYGVEMSTVAEIAEGRTIGYVEMSARITWSSAEGDESIVSPFDLELVLRGVFDWSLPDLEEDHIRAWLEFNSRHLMWPYLRSYVQMISGLADTPPLTIFTVGVPRPRISDEVPSSGVSTIADTA